VQVNAEDVEVPAIRPELGPLVLELRLDDRLAVSEHADLADELVDPLAVVLDRGREHALAVLHLAEALALLLEFRVQVLRRGRRGERDQRGKRGERRSEHDGAPKLSPGGSHAAGQRDCRT
jgi:hypothetical protein